MGAKDWFICNADRNVASVLGARPELDRLATEELVGRLFPTYAAVCPARRSCAPARSRHAQRRRLVCPGRLGS